MNKILKVVTPAVIAAVVLFFVLIISGMATTTFMDSERNSVTRTTFTLDINVFAGLVIGGAFVAVLASSYLLERVDKPAPKKANFSID
jgi:hypothetical protein